MHDPMTQAFEVPKFWKRKDQWGSRPALATIWHVDPEKDGTDNSCGWFMRAKHGDPSVLAKIETRFSFDWSRQLNLSDGTISQLGMFDNSAFGWPVLSIHAIALNLFFLAALEVFGGRDRAMKFIQHNLAEILLFAENPTDSLHSSWLHRYGVDEREDQQQRIHASAACIYGWILRASRPWYKHPRWHVWHWRIQIHPLEKFKRWAFSRCCKCGKGFAWGYSPITYSWNGSGPRWFRSETDIFHANCDQPNNYMAAATEVGDER